MPDTWNALYLGNSATQMDPVEGNDESGNASAFLGTTFGSSGSPLADQIVEVTANDVSGNAGMLDTDNSASSDFLQYDIGAGPESAVIDSTVVFSATITYMDGSTATISAVVFQDMSGNMFLAPEMSNNADTMALEAKGIESLTLDSIIDNNTNLTEIRYDTNFVCFVGGTRIQTPSGPRRIEHLCSGDYVDTLDNGVQRVAWIGRSKVSGQGKTAPIRIRAGALGLGRPFRDLYVSRQHRMLITSPSVRRLLGLREVFLPAFRLLDLPDIEQSAAEKALEYWHIFLEAHHVLIADGAPAESFLPGVTALECMSRPTRMAFQTKFPALGDPRSLPAPARHIPTPRQQKMLVTEMANALERPLVSM